uniref:Uncharacterized protein n=1 Tax=Romanomermis culicivorax TaxID=13658 RepID=A0A915KZN6_ROMCU
MAMSFLGPCQQPWSLSAMQRLFHQPFFYKLIHKQHHKWSSPISLASRYCNPIEHVVSYDGPVLLGPVLTNAHTITTLIW